MNRDKIKQALDLFADDKYVESREILVNEVNEYKNSYLAESLGLQNASASVVNEDVDNTDDE